MAKKRPTIIDVAKKCRLSKSTVSLAFQPNSTIADATRIVVRETAKKIGYIPNQAARSMRTSSSKMIGIIIQDSLNPYYSDLVRQIEQNLREHGYDIIVAETEQDLDRERRVLDRMQERQVDGVIISPMDYSGVSPLLERFEAGGIHCVVMGAPSYDIPFDAIDVDLRSATQTAMDYLIGIGHKNIAFVCGAPAWQNVSGRLQTFETKMKEHDLPMRGDSIYRCGFTLRDGYEAGKHLLSIHPRPTAIFALNDLLAIGIIRAATDLGLSVPNDVSEV
jgi:LacI family transcriptional regulator